MRRHLPHLLLSLTTSDHLCTGLLPQAAAFEGPGYFAAVPIAGQGDRSEGAEDTMTIHDVFQATARTSTKHNEAPKVSFAYSAGWVELAVVTGAVPFCHSSGCRSLHGVAALAASWRYTERCGAPLPARCGCRGIGRTKVPPYPSPLVHEADTSLCPPSLEDSWHTPCFTRTD